MKLDLHGKTWTEAQDDFIEAYNKILGQSRRETLDIVHGYGSTGQGGVIRRRLRAYLDRHPAHLTYKTGEDVDGNPGHTVVTPVKRFPSLGDQLAEELWDYCSEPRTTSKIMGKFRRHGDPTVQRAIDKLVSQHRLLRIGDKVSHP